MKASATAMSFQQSEFSSHVRSGGFTLVEVIVSLGILSLLLVVTVSSLRTFGNTQVSLQKMTDRVDDIRIVSSYLREALENSVPGEGDGKTGGLTMGGGGTKEPAFFEGSSKAMIWKASLLLGEGYGGTFLVRLARENDKLVLRWQDPPRRRNTKIEWTDTAARPLVYGLEEFTVRYRADFGHDWQDEWAEKGAPSHVRIALKAANRYWPDLILRVQR